MKWGARTQFFLYFQDHETTWLLSFTQEFLQAAAEERLQDQPPCIPVPAWCVGGWW